MELWSRREPVTLFGAIGMSESGWDQLSHTFSWVASRFSNVSDFRFDVEVVEVSGDMAYTLGFERFDGSIAGRPVEPVTVRVTHIYRREDGEWKIVHRHADNPGHDPRATEGHPARGVSWLSTTRARSSWVQATVRRSRTLLAEG